MALFQPMPTGSGKLTPIFPNLVLRFSTDGLGLVFEDTSLDFLLVMNGDYLDRAIEYSPGLFTPVLHKHTAVTVGGGGAIGGLIRPGPTSASFKSYPEGLPYDFEVDKIPTANSPYGFPPNYTDFGHDSNWDPNQPGDGRRSVTAPPFRGARYHPNSAKQGEAFNALLTYCYDQLRRPIAHISAPGVPFKNVEHCGNGWPINKDDTNRKWSFNHVGNAPDHDGIMRPWQSTDPAHNDTTFEFELACSGHPLGLCILFLVYSWAVQGNNPKQLCFPGDSWGGLFDQPRGIMWRAAMCMRMYLCGFQYADPNLFRDWCGGLDGKNGGLGWDPRTALREHVETWCGPDYGGRTTPQSRYMYVRTKTGSGSTLFGHQPNHEPCGAFSYNGIDYGKVFGQERQFHRYLETWGAVELIRAHDYLLTLDPTEFLLDPARIAELREWARHLAQYNIDVGMLGEDVGATGWGAYLAYASLRAPYVTDAEIEAEPLGFESFEAIDAAVKDAILCRPNNVDTGNPWVYPGTNPRNRDHVFVKQHEKWERAAGLWHLYTGFDTGETEAQRCGPPAYAMAFGYDDNLQASINVYPDLSDVTKPSAVKHYEVVWRAKEKYDSGTRKSPAPGTVVAISVPPTLHFGDVRVNFSITKQGFCVVAATLGGYQIGNPAIFTPEPATAVAATVDPTYTVIGTGSNTYRPPKSYAVAAAVFGEYRILQSGPLLISPPAAFAIAEATGLIVQPDIGAASGRHTPNKSFCTTQALLGGYSLSGVSKTPAVGFAIAANRPPFYLVEAGKILTHPEEAFAIARAVDPTYTIITPGGGNQNKRPRAVTAVCASTFGGYLLTGGATLTPPVSSAVAASVDPSYTVTTPPGTGTEKPAPAFAIAAAVAPTYQIAAAVIPELGFAIAVAVDPTYRLDTSESQPPPVFAIAAAVFDSYTITDQDIPLNVQEVGVEIADVQATEARV